MRAERAARSAMGIWVTRKAACDDRNALEGEQWRAWWEAEVAWMVEVAIERGHRRFTLALARRI
jgi:hypothetical protein